MDTAFYSLGLRLQSENCSSTYLAPKSRSKFLEPLLWKLRAFNHSQLLDCVSLLAPRAQEMQISICLVYPFFESLYGAQNLYLLASG